MTYTSPTGTMRAYEFEPTEWGIATAFANGYMFALHIRVEGYKIDFLDGYIGKTSNTSLEWQCLKRMDGKPMNDFEIKHAEIEMFNKFGNTENAENNGYFGEWDLDKPHQSLFDAFMNWQAVYGTPRATFKWSQKMCAELDAELWQASLV